MKNSEQPINQGIHENQDGTLQYDVYRGLTKREYFAAMAMQGWIACQHEGFSGNPTDIAKRSIECADALLTELENKQL